MVLEYLVFLVAGLVTGVVTGMVGASALVVFVPIVLLFFDYSLFSLIGLSLAVDTFVSLTSFWTYKKFGHVNIKLGIYLSVIAVLGAIVGSYVSILLPTKILSVVTGVFTCFTGFMIILRKSSLKNKKPFFGKSRDKLKFGLSFILAFFIGLVGGAVGAAGGVSLLLLFIFVMGFEIHLAIGTSVFVMFFIALSGAVSHFYYEPISFSYLVFGAIGGIIGARYSSRIANLLSEKTLNKIVGAMLFVFGIIVIVKGLV